MLRRLRIGVLSVWPTFAEKARKLIGNDHYAAVFGWGRVGRAPLPPGRDRPRKIAPALSDKHDGDLGKINQDPALMTKA